MGPCFESNGDPGNWCIVVTSRYFFNVGSKTQHSRFYTIKKNWHIFTLNLTCSVTVDSKRAVKYITNYAEVVLPLATRFENQSYHLFNLWPLVWDTHINHVLQSAEEEWKGYLYSSSFLPLHHIFPTLYLMCCRAVVLKVGSGSPQGSFRWAPVKGE